MNYDDLMSALPGVTVTELRKALERAERNGFGSAQVFISDDPDSVSGNTPEDENLYVTMAGSDGDYWLSY